MEVEEVQRPCERVAHRSGENSFAAPMTVLLPVLKVRSRHTHQVRVFCGKRHITCVYTSCFCKAPHWTALSWYPRFSSTRQAGPNVCHQRLPPEQSPSASQALHHHQLLRPSQQTDDVQFGSKSANNCYHTYHSLLSHPLPPSWSVAAKHPTINCHHIPFITALPAWSVGAKLLCNN